MVFVGKYEWLLKKDTAEPDIFDLDTVEPVGAIPIAFLIFLFGVYPAPLINMIKYSVVNIITIFQAVM